MASGTDPYFFSRDILNRQAQARALGQTKGFTPEELSGIIRGNFQAQQEREVTERKLALGERAQAEQAAENRRQIGLGKKQALGQTLQGGTSLAIQSYNAGMWGDKGGTSTPNAALKPESYASRSPVVGTTALDTSAGTSSLDLISETVDTTAGKESLGLISEGQAGVTGATGTLGGSLVSGVGWGGLAGSVAGQVVHGKHQKQASIAAATLAGAYAGSSAGPYGALVGAIGGALTAIFG